MSDPTDPTDPSHPSGPSHPSDQDAGPAPKLSLRDRLLGRVAPGSAELTGMLQSSTVEGGQEMRPRARTSAQELQPGVRIRSLRLPEGCS